MKILYAGTLTPNDSALYRKWALERLGHEPVHFDASPYLKVSGLVSKIIYRLAMGPSVEQFNREIYKQAVAQNVDVVWCDKMLSMQPSTLRRLRAKGIASVNYTIDNPFGPRKDPGWRLYRKAIPYYDLHVVQRDQNILDYKARGAKHVVKIQTAYEPTLHFPPPAGWSDADCNREVSFIGSPYDNRAEFFTRLWREYKIPLTISGNERAWRRALQPEVFDALFRHGELFLDAYREGIWRSKINLSFITHSNCDEFTHKSFEIAGCGAFLLAERSQGHLDRFREDEEAVFFSSLEECAEKIQHYLRDEPARRRIAAAGARRAEADGYHNDGQVQKILDSLHQIVPAVKQEAKK
ncbi:MAG: CgeB family protein [Acidobacteriaceae bacterium]